MKRIKYLFVCLSILFLTNSCEENGIFFPPSDNNGIFEVAIDGKDFTTTSVNFIIDDDDLIITAFDPDTTETFTLMVEDFDVASFSFEGINNVASFSQIDSNNPFSTNIWTTNTATSSRGSIAFTSINLENNTISGTFSFIGNNDETGGSKAFSNGSFSNIVRSSRTIIPDNFTAKIDGAVYEDVSLFANTITIGTSELISINANRSSSETITINLDNTITVGTYDFGSFATQSYPTGQYNVNDVTYEATTGKLTINSHDRIAKKISGSFNFEANATTGSTPAFEITEGVFNISY